MKKCMVLGVVVLACQMMFNSSVLAQTTAPANTPAAVAAAVSGKSAAKAAEVLATALEQIMAADLTDARKREMIIAVTSAAVSAAGDKAAGMMAIVVPAMNPVWVPVITATAVVASGDLSPAVAAAILAAVADNAALRAVSGLAAGNPGSVLVGAELTSARTTASQFTPASAGGNAGAGFFRSAELYPGQ